MHYVLSMGYVTTNHHFINDPGSLKSVLIFNLSCLNYAYHYKFSYLVGLVLEVSCEKTVSSQAASFVKYKQIRLYIYKYNY